MRRLARQTRLGKRKFLLKIFLGVCATVVALAFGETGLRVAERVDPDFNRYGFLSPHHGERYVYDPLLGWRNVPGKSPPGAPVQMTINSKGLRGSERPFEKPQPVRRILVLGDSFVFGFAVNDEETFCAVLEQEIHKRGGPYEVLNTGVISYGTDQEYLYFREEGQSYSPDVVVLALFTRNDFEDNVRTYYIQDDQVNASRCKPLVDPQTLQPTNVPVAIYTSSSAGDGKGQFVRPRWLVRYSALYRLAFFRAMSHGWLLSAMDKLGLCVVEEKMDDLVDRDPVETTVALVRGIAECCRQQGTPLVVMKFGELWSGEAPFVALRSDEFEATLCGGLPGVYYFDLDAAFVHNGLRVEELSAGIDGYHWNPFGHRQVGMLLLDYLDQQNLLKGAEQRE